MSGAALKFILKSNTAFFVGGIIYGLSAFGG